MPKLKIVYIENCYECIHADRDWGCCTKLPDPGGEMGDGFYKYNLSRRTPRDGFREDCPLEDRE